MREIYSKPTRLKQLAGIAGGVVFALGMSLPGADKADSSHKTVRDLYPESAWRQCDPSLWEHVHGEDLDGVPGPDRLEIINPCKNVFGTIIEIKPQEDGDLHVLLRPDPSQLEITLDPRFRGNVEDQKSSLVIESVCATPIEDERVMEEGVCEDFKQQFEVKIGEHVRMMGSYVYDINKDHENGAKWLEIHPITSIEEVK